MEEKNKYLIFSQDPTNHPTGIVLKNWHFSLHENRRIHFSTRHFFKVFFSAIKGRSFSLCSILIIGSPWLLRVSFFYVAYLFISKFYRHHLYTHPLTDTHAHIHTCLCLILSANRDDILISIVYAYINIYIYPGIYINIVICIVENTTTDGYSRATRNDESLYKCEIIGAGLFLLSGIHSNAKNI